MQMLRLCSCASNPLNIIIQWRTVHMMFISERSHIIICDIWYIITFMRQGIMAGIVMVSS